MKIKLIIVILISFISVFIVYIDYKYFYNIKKYSAVFFDDEIDLYDYEMINKIFKYENQLNAHLNINNSKPFLQLNGFDDLELDTNNFGLLKRNSLHQTQQMAIFTMSYLTEYLLKNLNEGSKIDNHSFNIIKSVYNYVSTEFLNPLSINNMTFNDQVVSERIQFDILYLSYLKKFHQNEKKLIRLVNKDLKICASFLLDNKQFNAFTNHGLMQLRAMTLLADCTENNNLKLSLKSKINERLFDILPYFVGDDGAVYEAASGYWLLIINQLTMILNSDCIKNTEVCSTLKLRLQLANKFIRTVITDDGFLQGLGDSYNQRIVLSNYLNSDSYKKYIFSNNLAGYKFTTNNLCISALFVSLNTPPNVHKLPEDLSIYLYAGAPFFINTGIYSYDNSNERKNLFSENSQSTVRFLKNKCQNFYSFIETKNNCFIGHKIYQNSDTVSRIFSLQSNGFKSIDYSSTNSEIQSTFFVAPETSIHKLNDTVLIMKNIKGVELKLVSNVKYNLKKSLISNNYNSLTEVDCIRYTGKKVVIKYILSSDYKVPATLINNSVDKKIGCNRIVSLNKFKNKYGSNIKDIMNFRNQFYYSLIITLTTLFMILSVLFFIKSKKKNNL